MTGNVTNLSEIARLTQKRFTRYAGSFHYNNTFDFTRFQNIASTEFMRVQQHLHTSNSAVDLLQESKNATCTGLDRKR